MSIRDGQFTTKETYAGIEAEKGGGRGKTRKMKNRKKKRQRERGRRREKKGEKKRGEFRRPRYIYEESLPLMVSMRSDARVPVPRSMYIRVYTRACVGRFLMCARVRCTSLCTQSSGESATAKGEGGKGGKEGGGERCGGRAHGLHGRELCLARDVKLLAIS